MQFFAMPCATNVLTKILKKINLGSKRQKEGATQPVASHTTFPTSGTPGHSIPSPTNHGVQQSSSLKTRSNVQLLERRGLIKPCDQRKKKLITLPQSRRRLGPSLRRHDVPFLPHTHSFASMDNSCVLTSFFQFHFFTLVFSPPNLSDGRKRSNWR